MSLLKIFSKQRKKGIELRPYQITSTNKAIDILVNRGLSFMLSLPAQTGKTLTLYNIVKESGFITLFATPRKFITSQGAKEAEDFFGKESVGYINSKTTDDIQKRTGLSKLEQEIRGKRIVVADLKTVINRVKNNPNMFKHFELLAIDEAHYNPNDVAELRKLLNWCYQLGVTATPFDAKGKYLKSYDVIYDVHSTREMVKNGYLSRAILYYASIFGDEEEYDCHLNKGIDGEYTDSSIAVATNSMAGKIRTDTILKHTLENKIINRKDRALVYAGSVDEAEHIVNVYRSNGINAVSVHSKSIDQQEIINGFNTGKYSVLVSVNMLVMGVVIKNVKTSVYFRKISSWVTLTQITNRGRGKNPWDKDIPVKHYHYTKTLMNLGHPDYLKPYHDEDISGIKTLECIECNSDLSKTPMKVIGEHKEDGYTFVTKECIVCGYTQESERSTNADELYDGTFNMITFKQQEQIKHEVQEAKAIRVLTKNIQLIEDELYSKGIKSKGFILELDRVAEENSRKNGKFLVNVFKYIKENDKNTIKRNINNIISQSLH